MSDKDDILLGNSSDVGRARERNEDYFACYEYDDAELAARKGFLAILADGMGGFAGGYAASRIAVEVVRREYEAHPSDDPREALYDAIEAANQEIYQSAQEDQEFKDMGTTLTALVYRQGKAHLAHVGDSRAYLIRDGEIKQLTRDHSMVDRMLREGLITPKQAEEHPEKNVLEQAVGHKPEVDVDISVPPLRTRPGDRLLLCSDGLHGQVSDREMARIVGAAEPNEACAELVDLANERGGPDNITVQILQVTGPGCRAVVRPPGDAPRSGASSSPAPVKRPVLTGVAALLLVGLGLGAGYLLFGGQKPDVEQEPAARRAVPPPAAADAAPPDPKHAAIPDAGQDLPSPRKAVTTSSRRRAARRSSRRSKRHQVHRRGRKDSGRKAVNAPGSRPPGAPSGDAASGSGKAGVKKAPPQRDASKPAAPKPTIARPGTSAPKTGTGKPAPNTATGTPAPKKPSGKAAPKTATGKPAVKSPPATRPVRPKTPSSAGTAPGEGAH